MLNPYEKGPNLASQRFILRLVAPEDARDLLKCYSDQKTVTMCNADNCLNDFYYDSLEKMEATISYWKWEYDEGNYVRLSIVDKGTSEAVGTIEIFAKEAQDKVFSKPGLLRLDLRSDYEREDVLHELLSLVEADFGELFSLHSLLTKCKPLGVTRKKALLSRGYQAIEAGSLISYPEYYGKVIL